MNREKNSSDSRTDRAILRISEPATPSRREKNSIEAITDRTTAMMMPVTERTDTPRPYLEVSSCDDSRISAPVRSDATMQETDEMISAAIRQPSGSIRAP